MPQNPILVVDDEPFNQATIEAILGDTYSLVFASNGLEAIAMAEKHHPSLILMDVQMPDMDGYEACRRLKADPRTESIPVIFVTGLGDYGHEAEGFNAGGVDYIIKPFSLTILKARVNTHLSLVRSSKLDKSHRDAIRMLGEAGHFNDTDTGAHIWRMASYAGLIAAAYGLDREMCELIEQAAPMHDTGKIGISHAILKKPGPLTDEEWVEMRTHSRIGFNILAKSNAPLFRMAAEIALYHHERWDGTGYPQGLAGEAIPVSARVVALADVFDALTMKRPYKEPWPMEKVLATVQESSGSHFEPRMVEAFEAVLPAILNAREQWSKSEEPDGNPSPTDMTIR